MSLVILSGGQDSATVLAMLAAGPIHTRPQAAIHFHYGQRNQREFAYAEHWADRYGIPLRFQPVEFMGSALTDHEASLTDPHDSLPSVPASFVPGRNLIFATLAAGHAQSLGLNSIALGVSDTESSGYPDCSADTMKSLTQTLRLGLAMPQLRIITPLLHKTKAGTFAIADKLGILPEIITHTLTCYTGNEDQHAWGRGCNNCPACTLRQKGFNEYERT